MCTTFLIFKKMLKMNNHQMGEKFAQSGHASIPTADGISYLCKLQFFQFEAKLHRTDDAFLLVSFTSAVSKVHTYIHK
jgi:hypothetical protein